jgi:hypothetical protein
MLAQLVFATGLETHPEFGAQGVVDAQADLQPLAWPFPQRQPLPSAPQMHPLVAAHETFCPRQLVEPVSVHAVLSLAQRVFLESAQTVLRESAQAALLESPQRPSVAQADEQLECCQGFHFAPDLQPGNPATSKRAIGPRAIHRLKASMRNTPLNRSSRHSVQNSHAGAIRAKTGN